MLNQKRSLFRKESLERLSSPERLDQLMRVIGPNSWLPLTSLCFLIVIATIWSIYGRIPITIQGRGVLIYPQQVVPIQATGSGQLLSLNVKVGDVVKKGQVIATINQNDLQKQLHQQVAKLAELQAQNQSISFLQKQQTQMQQTANQQQRQYLEQRIQQDKILTPLLKATDSQSIEQQRQSILQSIREEQTLRPILRQRFEAIQWLLKQKLVTTDIALQSEQQYLDNEEKIATDQANVKQLDAKQAQAKQSYLQNVSDIANLTANLKDLATKEASEAQQNIQNEIDRKNQIQEVKRNIGQLEVQLADNSEVISKYNGRILELTVTPGQVVSPGTRIASIAAEESSSKLVGVTFFSIGDGKKIKPGMKINITPETVEESRYGGIMGTVTNISPFPITQDAATNVIGNTDLVHGLVSSDQTGVIQVYGQLNIDSSTFSGYKWSSSKGPQLKISSGTTTTARVTIEQRAPITFILPILKQASGIY